MTVDLEINTEAKPLIVLVVFRAFLSSARSVAAF